MPTSNLILPIKAATPSKHFEPIITEIEAYLRDESKLTGEAALGVFRPKELLEVKEILAQIAKEKAKVTISAARTGVTGGGIPDKDSYVVSLERLTGLVSVNQKDLEITVLAGTSWTDLNRLINEHLPDYFFPIDPTEQSASIGGAAALNAGGARSLRFGSVRNWITGLKFLLVTGEELNIRRGEICAKDGLFLFKNEIEQRELKVNSIKKPLTKNTIGYWYDDSVDLVDLLIGSEGALGVIVEVSLKVEKKPPMFLSHLQIFSSLKSGLACVEFLRNSKTFPPYSLEFIDYRSIDKLFERPKAALDKFIPLLKDAEAALFIEIPFNSEADLLTFSESFFEFLVEINEDPERALSGTDDRTLSEIKKLRHAVPERMNEIIAERKLEYPSLHKLGMDMSVPDKELLWVYDLYESELSKAGFDFVIFGHAGNNHFHVNILPRDLDELDRAKNAYLELSTKIVSRGGAVAAEHGIGRIKKKFLQVQYSEKELESFDKIKRFFDPELRLNSHVLV